MGLCWNMGQCLSPSVGRKKKFLFHHFASSWLNRRNKNSAAGSLLKLIKTETKINWLTTEKSFHYIKVLISLFIFINALNCSSTLSTWHSISWQHYPPSPPGIKSAMSIIAPAFQNIPSSRVYLHPCRGLSSWFSFPTAAPPRVL